MPQYMLLPMNEAMAQQQLSHGTLRVLHSMQRESPEYQCTFQLMTFFMPLCSTAMGKSPLS